jgi:dTDP-glucose pyrophosphorylase
MKILVNGAAWLDTGTHESLLERKKARDKIIAGLFLRNFILFRDGTIDRTSPA